MCSSRCLLVIAFRRIVPNATKWLDNVVIDNVIGIITFQHGMVQATPFNYRFPWNVLVDEACHDTILARTMAAYQLERHNSPVLVANGRWNATDKERLSDCVNDGVVHIVAIGSCRADGVRLRTAVLLLIVERIEAFVRILAPTDGACNGCRGGLSGRPRNRAYGGQYLGRNGLRVFLITLTLLAAWPWLVTVWTGIIHVG